MILHFYRPNKTFKLKCAWVFEEAYGDMIEDVWNEMVDLMTNLVSIKLASINWHMITVKVYKRRIIT